MITRKLSKKQQKLETWRQKFLSGLESAGLEMEDVRYLILLLLVPEYLRSM